MAGRTLPDPGRHGVRPREIRDPRFGLSGRVRGEQRVLQQAGSVRAHRFRSLAGQRRQVLLLLQGGPRGRLEARRLRRTPLPRLACRAGPRHEQAAGRPAGGFHDPQPGLPGNLPARSVRRYRASHRYGRSGRPRVPRRIQFHEGRDPLLRAGDHGQPHLRIGGHDPGGRIRDGGAAPAETRRGPSRGNPERHRQRTLGPRGRSVDKPLVHAGQPSQEIRVPQCAPRRMRTDPSRQRHRGRGGIPSDMAEGSGSGPARPGGADRRGQALPRGPRNGGVLDRRSSLGGFPAFSRPCLLQA